MSQYQVTEYKRSHTRDKEPTVILVKTFETQEKAEDYVDAFDRNNMSKTKYCLLREVKQ